MIFFTLGFQTISIKVIVNIAFKGEDGKEYTCPWC